MQRRDRPTSGQPGGAYRATLFDLDGTLLETLEDLAVSMNAALDSAGFPTHPVQASRRP